MAWVDGEQEWDMVSLELTNGVHELTWVYSKDESGAAGYDRAWIRDVLFKNTTLETPVEVPYSWLDSYPELMTIAKGDYEAAATISVSEGVPHVSYTPNLGDARKYKTWGKKFLADKTWMEVPPGKEAEYNFFKVTVEMK